MMVSSMETEPFPFRKSAHHFSLDIRQFQIMHLMKIGFKLTIKQIKSPVIHAAAYIEQMIPPAGIAKHQMNLRAGMAHSDNPYHAQHIREFCDYTDKAVSAMGQSIMEALPALIRAELQKPEIKVKVDEKSLQTVKQKVGDLFRSLGSFWR